MGMAATEHKARVMHVFDGSTRVDTAWYDETNKVIEILFPDRVRWLFFDIEPATWQRFTRAESPGRFLRDILERHANRRR